MTGPDPSNHACTRQSFVCRWRDCIWSSRWHRDCFKQRPATGRHNANPLELKPKDGFHRTSVPEEAIFFYEKYLAESACILSE